jgi:amino acid transporter
MSDGFAAEVAREEAATTADFIDKGLKAGAIGLASSVVIALASTAPAYSLASSLGGVVATVGLHAPAIALIAFIPMLFVSFGYNELNRVEPDCGTTFTWGVKAVGPKTGWLGGWGILAADILVMASLSQVAGQYVFLFLGDLGWSKGTEIGSNPISGWVLLVGIGWIILMGLICYVGIEVSANLQKGLLGLESVMLAILAVVALVKVYSHHGTSGSVHPSLSWLWIGHLSPSTLAQGIILMVFIYWGWDTAVSVNEETKDPDKTPGRAAVISTVLLLAIYGITIIGVQAYAGAGTTGVGLANPTNSGDVLSVLGSGIFGVHGLGRALASLLLLMVLTSASASTQTTIMPTARTSLAMAAYQALPRSFANVHPRFKTPTTSTVVFCIVSTVFYVAMNYVSGGNIIYDSVTALGWAVAFYYGLTGFLCAWYFRGTLRESARNLWLRGILPALGGVLLFLCWGFSMYQDWNPANTYTSWTLPLPPHWQVGGVFVIGVVTALIGVVLMLIARAAYKPFFSGQVLSPIADLAEIVREG